MIATGHRVRFAAWHGIVIGYWENTGGHPGASVLWSDGIVSSIPVASLSDAGSRMPWKVGRWRISRTPLFSMARGEREPHWHWHWVVTFPWPVNGLARTEVVPSQQAGLALIEQARREGWQGA